MAVKLHETETTVGDAIVGAYSILEELRDEIADVLENMINPDGDRGQVLQETLDNLDSIVNSDPPEPEEGYADIACVYGANRRRSQSRSDRRDEAVRMLTAASDAIQSRGADIEDDEDMADDVEALGSIVRELDEAISNADACEFPGMMG